MRTPQSNLGSPPDPSSLQLGAAEIGLAKRPASENLLSFHPSAVTRASSIAMAGGIVSQGLKFLVVIYVARRFSTIEFGWFSFAVAVNAYITIISNFGLPVFGSRVISKSACVPRELLQEIVCARLILATAALAVSVGVLSLLPQVGRMELILVSLFGLSNLPLAGLLDWVFQGLHRQDLSALINIIWQACWVSFSLVCVAVGLGILGIGVALTISATVAAATGYLWIRWCYVASQTSGSTISILQRTRTILNAAASLGWGTMLISIIVWSDAICVRLLRGEFAVAVYAAGNRAALALSMLGTFFVQGAFPLLSRASNLSNSLFEKCFAQTLSDLAIVFVPGSLWAIWYANAIITLVFRRSEFVAAVPVFRIFQVSLLLFVINTLLGTDVLVVFHQDASFRSVLMASTALFLILCPLFTWKWDTVGAAVAVLTSQAFAFILFFIKAKKLSKINIMKAVRWPFLLGLCLIVVSASYSLTVEVSIVPLACVYLILISARWHQRQTSLA